MKRDHRAVEIATRSADASGQFPINKLGMLRMLEIQGMQPHNVQEQTQSSHPSRKIDQTQIIPEMSGMATKKCKKPCVFSRYFPK